MPEKFEVLAKSEKGEARAGFLNVQKGKTPTPLFLPVATKGAMKFLSLNDIHEIGVQGLISNAFILYMEPGLEVIKKAGGLENFMNWHKCQFTDSGGFQLLLPEFFLGIGNRGIRFRNPFTHAKMFFTPEQSISIQNELNSDVAMALDDVPSFGKTKEDYSISVKRTIEWAKRCKQSHNNEKQLIFCIGQGGTFMDLRKKCLQELNKMDFDGIAFGGLSIGEGSNAMLKTAKACVKVCDKKKPRYLMGLGSPADILNAIDCGVDIFDSCYPTRTARHRMAFTWEGNIYLEKQKFKADFGPLDEHCNCYVCKNHSRAFLHHLVKTKEENGWAYLSYHNVAFNQQLVNESRTAILEGDFEKFKKERLEKIKEKK